MLIWHLVQQLGVRWSRGERARRLFRLCVQVQARLMARYPDYHNLQVHHIPPAVVEEVEDMLSDILGRHRRAASAGTDQAAQPDPRL
jgi:hypothetical protein